MLSRSQPCPPTDHALCIKFKTRQNWSLMFESRLPSWSNRAWKTGHCGLQGSWQCCSSSGCWIHRCLFCENPSSSTLKVCSHFRLYRMLRWESHKRTSLVVQWLRLCLPVQGTWFAPRSREIPHAMEQPSRLKPECPEARIPQEELPQWGTCALQPERSHCSWRLEKTQQRRPSGAKDGLILKKLPEKQSSHTPSSDRPSYRYSPLTVWVISSQVFLCLCIKRKIKLHYL